ncbi:hypothetical protein GALMADRAFT_244771 [Galerina marginata CBS 339.88]|uniref:Uncharacterized protein n=1 Tax=Galerina marginata (strain CBS 339.88) TaxID=685588 RepID=A0A067TGK6_GALM3|nr:hypothetical protein GALMADRAFT_244771 [Galerina marginata CBS 339.88]
MSFALRTSLALPRRGATRAFHSPFAVLGTSPLTAPSTKDISNQTTSQYDYEKQYDHPPEPVTSHSGYRTYVVSEPDASYKHYQVPAGAYPTSAPYVNFPSTAAPEVKAGDQYSSTSGELLAHGFTTRAARQHTKGVGESSAVRHGSAPGEMGARGGGYGGGSLMDEKGTQSGVGSLGERNPQPDGEVAETYSKAGIDGAWKLRK